MNNPDLTALIDGTWPAASVTRSGPFVIRAGRGGGSRVSAASLALPQDTPIADLSNSALDHAETAMQALNQTPLFMVRKDEEALDTALQSRGYVVKDPVALYSIAVQELATQRPPPVTSFEIWPPLAIQAELWQSAGIGPERLAVMARATGPRTTLLGRLDDTPAGCAFVACHGPRAMLHALEIMPRFRRRGLAVHMMRAAGFWAQENGAKTLSVLVTQANAGGNALYQRLGMHRQNGYHYRIHPDAQ